MYRSFLNVLVALVVVAFAGSEAYGSDYLGYYWDMDHVSGVTVSNTGTLGATYNGTIGADYWSGETVSALGNNAHRLEWCVWQRYDL